MSRIISFSLLGFFIIAASLSAYAAIVNVPGDQPTIQAGINAAVTGDTVLVADGTYLENIDFKGKAITVASHYIMDGDTNHWANTIINGSQPNHPDSGSVVYFVSGEDTNSVLCGFTITGGTGTLDSTYYWDDFTRLGGGILSFSNSRICHNLIHNNYIPLTRHAAGGGIFGGDYGGQHLIIEHNRITSNSVTSDSISAGGGILMWFADGRITNNVIEDNSITSEVTTRGGGIFCGTDVNNFVTIDSNVIKNNTSYAVLGHSYGGGMDCEYTSLSICDNVIVNNSSLSEDYSDGGGIRLGTVISSEILRNRILSNIADDRGGGIYMINSIATVQNNLIAKNEARYGGGVRIYNNLSNRGISSQESRKGNSSMDHTKSLGHYSSSAYSAIAVRIINNTIVDNSAYARGGGINVTDISSIIMNSILYGNEAQTGDPQIYLSSGNPPEVRYSNIEGGWTGTGNIAADPLFADTIDFKLSDASPCINAGVDSIQIGGVWYYAPPVDLGGNPRLVPDMGAWENSVITGIQDGHQGISLTYSLGQNYPNPFNPSTTIEFVLPQADRVTLKIYNILGEEVTALVSERLSAGKYKYEWSQTVGIASGVYLYRLQAGNYVETKKMILMK